MIQLHTRDLCILGLTKENLERLRAGEDISFDYPKRSTFKTMVLTYGETKPEILHKVEQLGFVISPKYYTEAEKDPS